MSYDTAKSIGLEWVFSWGYVDNTPESLMGDKFSPYLRNARLFGQAIESRPWHTLHATMVANPYGIGSYLRSNPANNVLIVRANQSGTQKLASITESGTITNITTSTSIASDNRMWFENVWDVLYCMNGSDNYGKLSGTTYTTPTTGISNFAPAFWVVFNSSMFASGWSTNSNKVYKSVWDNYDDFNSTGSDSFTFQEQITWLATNNEAIFYFTKNTVSATGKSDITDTGTTISYITRGIEVKGGAVNHYSIISAWINIYYLTSNNKIVKLARWVNNDWYEIIELSHRKDAWIDKIMATLDEDQTSSFGYYLMQENLIKWFVKSRWASFNDVCIVYDIIKDAFLIDTNKFFYGWVNFQNKNYTISHIEPKVYIDEFWYDDEDSAIAFRYETKYFDLWIPTIKKELWESRTYLAINNLASVIQNIIIDGNTIDSKVVDSDNIPIVSWGIGTTEIGTTAIGTEWFDFNEELQYVDLLRTRGNLQVKWKRIKYTYTNDTIGGRVRLEGIEMRVEVLPSITSNLTL